MAAPYKEPWPEITEADKARVLHLLERGEISYDGDEGIVRELEQRFRDYFSVEFALATNTGTSALHSAFFGIGLQPGDEVIAPTYTFLATAMPVYVCNAVPVLVDVDPDTGLLDPCKLASALTPRTKAIVVTHLSGFPVDMKQVMAFARNHGLAVVEDCAQAHGAICDGRLVGTWGDVAIFSLQGRKLVPAGEGGMLVTESREIYERATLLGHCREKSIAVVRLPQHEVFAETGWGLNYRMHPLAAAIAIGQMDRLEEEIELRSRYCSQLSTAIVDSGLIAPPVFNRHTTRPVYYSYQPIYRPMRPGLPREVFAAALKAEGIEASYPKSLPLHEAHAFRFGVSAMRTYGNTDAERLHRPDYHNADFRGADAYFSRALRIPIIRRADSDRQLAAIQQALQKIADNLGELVDAVSSGRISRVGQTAV